MDLKSPVYGKDGITQKGEYINSDTGETLTSFKLEHRGLYNWECIWVGENLKSVQKDGGFAPEDIEEISQSIVNSTPTLWYIRGILYAKKDKIVYLPGEFYDLEPTSIIHHYHAVYQFRHSQ